MLRIGEFNTLKVSKRVEFGLYFSDEEQNEVLLPKKYTDESMEIGSEHELFLYKDHEDRLTATTLEPKITLNKFAYLKVSQLSKFGAFMDWGIPKELFVPYAEQQIPLEEGESHVVRMFLDEKSNRLAASTKVEKFLRYKLINLQPDDKVWVIVYAETDLGYKVVVNNNFSGLIFKNEVFQHINIGDEIIAYVKQIRSDGKIDIALKQKAYKHIESDAKILLNLLNQNGGFLKVHDKSDPMVVKELTQLSKKAFKRAIGNLLKNDLITLAPNGVRLNKK